MFGVFSDNLFSGITCRCLECGIHILNYAVLVRYDDHFSGLFDGCRQEESLCLRSPALGDVNNVSHDGRTAAIIDDVGPHLEPSRLAALG